jgi:hypothetical protein
MVCIIQIFLDFSILIQFRLLVIVLFRIIRISSLLLLKVAPRNTVQRREVGFLGMKGLAVLNSLCQIGMSNPEETKGNCGSFAIYGIMVNRRNVRKRENDIPAMSLAPSSGKIPPFRNSKEFFT